MDPLYTWQDASDDAARQCEKLQEELFRLSVWEDFLHLMDEERLPMLSIRPREHSFIIFLGAPQNIERLGAHEYVTVFLQGDARFYIHHGQTDLERALSIVSPEDQIIETPQDLVKWIKTLDIIPANIEKPKPDGQPIILKRSDVIFIAPDAGVALMDILEDLNRFWEWNDVTFYLRYPGTLIAEFMDHRLIWDHTDLSWVRYDQEDEIKDDD